MRALVRSLRCPAPALLWALVALGHALVFIHPLPARIQLEVVWIALGLGGASLVSSGLASTRVSGRRRTVLERAEAGFGLLALLMAGAALGSEADLASWPLPVHPRPTRVRLEGRVLDTTALDADPGVLVFEAQRVAMGKSEESCRARLELRFREEAGTPRWAFPGVALSVEGEYRPPEDARNPGVEPPGRWMERSGIEGTVEVDPHGVSVAADPPERGAAPSYVCRDLLARKFEEALAPPVSALARGMILGDRSRIVPAIRDAFRNGGTIHILSISGLHVCILGGFAALAASAFRLPLLPALACELLSVWFYTLLVGAPASALRAALLWTAVRGGRALGREVRPLAGWGLAGLLLHLAEPRAVHDPGFQLSFAAVLGLIGAGGLGGPDHDDGPVARRLVRRWLRGAAATALQSAGATAGTLGIASKLFGAIPGAGLLLNIAVVPLCGLVMAEAFLFLGVLGLGAPALRDAAAGALDASGLLLLAVNDWGARLLAPWPVRVPPPTAALLAVALLLLLSAALRERVRHEELREGRRLRRAAVVALLFAALLPIVPWPAGARERGRGFLLAIDVGQGDALLAQSSAGEALLVDAGPSDDARDMGRLAVEPTLRAEGVTRVRTALLSHAHRDHYGGLEWLTRRGWIERLFENGSDLRGSWRSAMIAWLLRNGGECTVIARDTTLTRTMALSVWAPPPDSLTRTRENSAENNRSLVATLEIGGVLVFLPGDAEEDAERDVLPRLRPVSIVKAPHHGSKTSSRKEWIEALAPRLALVSSGERNRFGHPDRSTLGRYRLAGAQVRRTDREGAIRVVFGRDGFWVSSRAFPEPEWIAR